MANRISFPRSDPIGFDGTGQPISATLGFQADGVSGKNLYTQFWGLSGYPWTTDEQVTLDNVNSIWTAGHSMVGLPADVRCYCSYKPVSDSGKLKIPLVKVIETWSAVKKIFSSPPYTSDPPDELHDGDYNTDERIIAYDVARTFELVMLSPSSWTETVFSDGTKGYKSEVLFTIPEPTAVDVTLDHHAWYHEYNSTTGEIYALSDHQSTTYVRYESTRECYLPLGGMTQVNGRAGGHTAQSNAPVWQYPFTTNFPARDFSDFAENTAPFATIISSHAAVNRKARYFIAFDGSAVYGTVTITATGPSNPFTNQQISLFPSGISYDNGPSGKWVEAGYLPRCKYGEQSWLGTPVGEWALTTNTATERVWTQATPAGNNVLTIMLSNAPTTADIVADFGLPDSSHLVTYGDIIAIIQPMLTVGAKNFTSVTNAWDDSADAGTGAAVATYTAEHESIEYQCVILKSDGSFSDEFRTATREDFTDANGNVDKQGIYTVWPDFGADILLSIGNFSGYEMGGPVGWAYEVD